jgi:16S rRNA C967 or C1407 C5-methylase (RsmB/RsmF family)/NOL1/NOP2/fmu family ribosome biogenesis protein
MKQGLPPAFLQLLNKSLPVGLVKELIDSLESEPKVSIRLNRSKNIHPGMILNSLVGDSIPHCDDGVLLKTRPLFTADPAFHAGAYYVQEANSMIIGELVKRILQTFEPGAVVLDLCASPGGKSTHIASVLRQGDLLVSNEVIQNRTPILIENLSKWGQGNHVVTSADAKAIGHVRGLFQIVVADMPCSGEGMFRKNPDAIGEWSAENVSLCSLRQQRITHDIWPSLAEDGVFIYSTCTYNRHENEDNVNRLVQDLDAEILQYDFPEKLGIVELEPGKYRMLPNKTMGEGFFFSVLRKTNKEKISITKTAQFKPTKNLPDFLGVRYIGYELQTGLMAVKSGAWVENYPNLPALLPSVKQTGVTIGQNHKNQWKIHPEYDLLAEKHTPYPALQLTTDQAIEYYKRAFLNIKSDQKGIVGLRWNGLSLGTANAVQNGLNNLWPMAWRILQNQMRPSTLLKEV